MKGEVVVITSATSSLGLAAAGRLARLGATVWLAVRSRERGTVARAPAGLMEVLGRPAHRTVDGAA